MDYIQIPAIIHFQNTFLKSDNGIVPLERAAPPHSRTRPKHYYLYLSVFISSTSSYAISIATCKPNLHGGDMSQAAVGGRRKGTRLKKALQVHCLITSCASLWSIIARLIACHQYSYPWMLEKPRRYCPIAMMIGSARLDSTHGYISTHISFGNKAKGLENRRSSLSINCQRVFKYDLQLLNMIDSDILQKTGVCLQLPRACRIMGYAILMVTTTTMMIRIIKYSHNHYFVAPLGTKDSASGRNSFGTLSFKPANCSCIQRSSPPTSITSKLFVRKPCANPLVPSGILGRC